MHTTTQTELTVDTARAIAAILGLVMNTTTQTELTVDTARAIAAVLTPAARSWDSSARFEVCDWQGLPCAVALIQGSTATAIFRYEEELADWAKTFTI